MERNNKEKIDSKLFLVIINQEIELIKESIDSIELQIKIRKNKIINLKNSNFVYFQVLRRKKTMKEIKKLEEEIEHYYMELNHELKNLYRMDIIKRNMK